MIRIENKNQMLLLLKSGAFGNTTRFFNSIDEALASGVGRFCIRYRGKVSFGEMNYWRPDVAAADLHRAFDELVSEGAIREQLYIAEWLEVGDLLFSGEIMESERGIELTYSYAKLPPREALLIDGHFAHAKEAENILAANLDSEAVNHLWEILYKFTGVVIEFAWFATPLGTMNQQIIIFEVRNY